MKKIYTAMKLAGIIKEETDPLEERMADLKQGLQQAESAEDALRMLYKWAIKKTIDEEEFVQLAMDFQ